MPKWNIYYRFAFFWHYYKKSDDFLWKNFIFDQNDNLNKDSAVFNLTFIDSKFEKLEIIPCRIEGKKKTVIAKDEEYKKIVEHMKKFSEKLGTELLEEDGVLVVEK